MALTRLDNLYSSKTGKYLYVSPDDFNATDELNNRGNSPLRPFKTIQRAFLEVARYSYLPGQDNDRFDQFSIMLMPGDHYIDNRPGLVNVDEGEKQRYLDARNLITLNRDEIVDRSFAAIALNYNETWGGAVADWVVPGDATETEYSRYFDAYRLINLNRDEIIENAYAVVAAAPPSPAPANLEDKCKRDIGYFVDAVSLDVVLGGGNRYTRKFIQNYFTEDGSTWIDNSLEGEVAFSVTAFAEARDQMILAITNQLTYKELSISTGGPNYGEPDVGNTNANACADVQTLIANLTDFANDAFTAQNIIGLSPEVVSDTAGAGQSKCKRDIGYLVDAVGADLSNLGNANSIAVAKAYFDKDGNPISNGLVDEEAPSIIAFNAAADAMKKAVTNQLYEKDLDVLSGPAQYGVAGPTVPNLPSGNENTCIDVQNTIETLVTIVTDVIADGNLTQLEAIAVTGDIPVFNYNAALEEWTDDSILDLSNPNNVLHKFNATTGGCIVPRGCSLIGYDLRRTIVRPLYVPDPADGTQQRTSIFNLTGGCYIWQFTIKDGDLTENSPLYDENDKVGKVYFQKGNNSTLAIPEYSHHKITIMTYADQSDLDQYYTKVAAAFALFQPTIDDGDLEALPQENRIVGPLSDTRSIVNIRLEEGSTPSKTNIVVTTKIAHGYFKGQYVAIVDNGLTDLLNGTFKVIAIDENDPKVFTYEISSTPAILGLDINAEGYSTSTTPALNLNARGQAEIDSVESASPYVFNCSIRSTWGMCGMWADGAKATGFKSMVVAQYTGVSLQRDDRAFIRYDEFTNTWNQASLTDAFATVPYHTKGDAYWKDDWRNFHIRASDDAFIQCVSVFAVGFFDHFLMESGGDMSITNSNSNFGNTSLHAIGFKGFSFNQDKGGYITDIIPVEEVDDSEFNETALKYYSISIPPTKDITNQTRLYYGTDEAFDPFSKPAVSIDGYRLGAKTDEQLFLKLKSPTGTIEDYTATVSPNGFLRYTVSLDVLNPDGITIDNKAQDAANLIELNKEFIQQEAYGYILQKYPYLLTDTSINISTCERDIGYFVDAIVSDLRLGGNINTIQAAEGYYVGGQLAYIQNELNETLDALDYVKNLSIAAMRNFDYLYRNVTTNQGSPYIQVEDTTGLIVGMKLTQYAFNSTNFENGELLPGATPVTVNPCFTTPVYIKRIIDSTTIEVGEFGSRLEQGLPVNAAINSTTAYFYFQLPQTPSSSDPSNYLEGAWAIEPAQADYTVLADPTAWGGADPDGYPECSGIATIIQEYFVNINLILNNGYTPLGGRESDASFLISQNKNLLVEEALDVVGVTFDPVLKTRLSNYVDALAFDIIYGGNSASYGVAEDLLLNASLLLNVRDELSSVIDTIGTLATQAMRNQTITITGDHGLTQYKDLTIIGDLSGLPGVYSIGDCADIASAIQTLEAVVRQAIGTDLTPGNLNSVPFNEPSFNSVTRVEPVLDTANLASRATIFTVNTGGSLSNPHNFETGTPVRLVPKIRDGVDPQTVDKRVIRLPRGLEPNKIYYVIAPGRTTYPEDYSNNSLYPDIFTSSEQTKLMLASTKENAAAGIYIYSSETKSIDQDVEIELQQYVLDEKYDLHQYKCNFITGLTDVIETDVPHIFDVPSSSQNIHKIFFRTFGDPAESQLPQIFDGSTSSPVETDRYYYARFASPKTFSVFLTESEAIAGSPRITFTNGFGQNFYVFSDKRRSPVKFDAVLQNTETTTGQWYINTINDISNPNNIIARMQELGDTLKDSRSKNATFVRLKDLRDAKDRIYRLRYVIPQYAQGVRDPLNGFVIKSRTDETRRLLPQRIVLEPVGSGAPDLAVFLAEGNVGGSSVQQQLGLSKSELIAAGTLFDYDPYNINQVKVVDSDKTTSKISFSIQSARQVDVNGNNRLELTVFDLGITNDQLRNELFTTVRIDAPQGGVLRSNAFVSEFQNKITWSGYSAGSGYLQAYFSVDVPSGGTEHYLIIKNIDENRPIEYNSLIPVRFAQPVLDGNGNPLFDIGGNPIEIFATLQAKPNSVGSQNQALSKSEKKDYLYSIKESNVLTVTPGDVILDDTGTQYQVVSVEDAGDVEDSFYIFDVDEVQRRIPNQQSGIYYLTCIKGNVSPYPTGSGVGTNFRNFKFSQPVSQLYPLDYKNDPLWFQIRPDGTRDTSIIDTPETICAADNFIHGLVRTNDDKNSETKEVILDFIDNPALERYEYVTNAIQAQSGNATSGSEDRLIPICGDSPYPTEGKFYVELRRPSIARSGNHTFEYLGFGPGNYSTGFPLRQEIVLQDVQDFYAQAKRENGGIVFYTGLNSNGDLYIGNRKINAITGEETFLEKAELVSSDDEGGDLGGLVTTFELPVVFEKDITVDGNANFNNPVTINVEPNESFGLTVVSNLDSAIGEDVTLDSSTFAFSGIPSEGNIVLGKNEIYAAVYRFNPRGNTALLGQNYSIRTHVNQLDGNKPTNHTPNQTDSRIGLNVSFGQSSPQAGDILLRGAEVGSTGSVGWIFSNFYEDISSAIFTVTSNGTNVVTFTLAVGVTNADLDIEDGATVRLSNLTGTYNSLNGIRTVFDTPTSNTFRVTSPFLVNSSGPNTFTGDFEISRNSWKEVGVVGTEAIRTTTDNYGDFRLGINTLARASHSTDGDQEDGFVSAATRAIATLDVVGNAVFAGRKLTIGSANNFLSNPLLSNRTFNTVDDALVVGFDPKTNALSNKTTLRVATTTIGSATNSNGRLGINTTLAELDRNFVLYGNARITDDLLLQSNLTVNGGSISTTSSSFNLLDANANLVNAFGSAEELNIANITTDPQIVNIGNVATSSEISIGRFSENTELYIHSNSDNSIVEIGVVGDSVSNTSIIRMGGAYGNNSNINSVFNIKNRYTNVDGNLYIGTYNPPGFGFSEFQTYSKQLDVFTSNVTQLNFATSVTRLGIGGAGGFTTINNSLVVENELEVNGDIFLTGGLNAGAFTVLRGSLGTPPSIHARGNIDTLNVDIYKRVVISKTIDTEGLGVWGGPAYQVDPLNPEEYFLPLGQTSSTEFSVGDYILIDRSVAVSGQTSPVGQKYSEFVQIVELTNLNDVSDLPLRVKVKRARNALTSTGNMVAGPDVDGVSASYRYLRTDHPDNAVLVKYDFSDNVSYVNNVGGLTSSNTIVETGIFSGTVVAGDILRFSDSELATITAINTTTNQSFYVTDGGNPPTTVFSVDSTNGNTNILGELTVNKSIFLQGSTTENEQRLVITTGVSGAERFSVDSATGNTCIFGDLGIGGVDCDLFTVNGTTAATTIRGGNLQITANDPTIDPDTGDTIYTEKFFLQNSTGNLRISGNLTVNGTGTSVFEGDLKINGSDLIVNRIVDDGNGNDIEEVIFKVENDGSIDFANQNGFFTPSGARKWTYITGGTDVYEAQSNINYFIAANADSTIKLPQNPTTGDIIRVVDVGGNLTFNVSLRFRAPTGIAVQGDFTNSGQGPNVGSGYNGGELVVQTPNAGLGLVFVGSINYDGTATGAPTSQQGWWLMEI